MICMRNIGTHSGATRIFWAIARSIDGVKEEWYIYLLAWFVGFALLIYVLLVLLSAGYYYYHPEKCPLGDCRYSPLVRRCFWEDVCAPYTFGKQFLCGLKSHSAMDAFKNALPLLFWICCVAVNVYSVWLFVVY